jgi:hypothetical protein
LSQVNPAEQLADHTGESQVSLDRSRKANQHLLADEPHVIWGSARLKSPHIVADPTSERPGS